MVHKLDPSRYSGRCGSFGATHAVRGWSRCASVHRRTLWSSPADAPWHHDLWSERSALLQLNCRACLEVRLVRSHRKSLSLNAAVVSDLIACTQVSQVCEFGVDLG